MSNTMNKMNNALLEMGWSHYAAAVLAVEVGVINEWLKVGATLTATVLAIYSIALKHMEIQKMRKKFFNNKNK